MASEYPDIEIRGENEGKKHGNSSERGGHNGAPDLLRALDHSRGTVFVKRSVAVDIFQYDYAVVQKHAHCQNQTRQGQGIESDLESIEKIERCQDRNRHGQKHGDHQSKVADKEPENCHCQQASYQSQLLDQIQVPLHLLGGIALDYYLYVQGLELFVQAADNLACGVRQVDKVCPGVLDKLDGHRLFAVDPADSGLVL